MKNFIFFENKIINVDRIDYVEYKKWSSNEFVITIHYSNLSVPTDNTDLHIHFGFETEDESKIAYKDLMNKLEVKGEIK